MQYCQSNCGVRLGAQGSQGFTLIELLVVLAAIALLLSIAAPRYVEHVDRAREAVLRSNLTALRDALDKYQSDKGRFPDKLQDLVDTHYLRSVPLDPFTERPDTWRLLPLGATPAAQAPADTQSGPVGQIADVRSTATGKARDGTPYAAW
jgi:general secretion pathway protein G